MTPEETSKRENRDAEKAKDDDDQRPRSVFVFAPAPLLTITIEEQGGVPDIHLHPGGQGFWIARMAASLGVPVTVCGCFGGETGRVAQALIERDRVSLRPVEVASANGAYIHDRRDGDPVPVAEMPSPTLSRHEIDELYSVGVVTGLDADVCVLGGPHGSHVLPGDVYMRLARDLAGHGKTVIADLSGDPLHAALEGGLYVLKMAHDEIQEDGFAEGESEEELIKGMHRLRDAGAANVVLSRSDQPALALVDDEVLMIHPPRLETIDTKGAGDSMTAGIAVALARGEDIRTGLRLGAAAGALNVTRRGLATGPGAEIEKLAGEVTLETLSDPAGSER